MLLSAVILFIGTIAAAQTKAAPAFKVEEQSFQRNGMKIYGKLFLPNSVSPVPLVILSHGFGGNHGGVKGYAAAFAEQGIAAYIFDFIGGGNHIKSDGKMTEMSVLTEAEDLTVILDNLKADSLVPLSYSERAIKTFPDAKLIKLDGAKHVFYGDMMQKAAEDAVEFVQSIIDEKRPQAR